MTAETQPPDWEYMQAVRYYYTFVRPRLAASGTHKVVDPPFGTKYLTKPLFIGRVICSRISRSAKTFGRSVRLGADPAFADLAAVYYRYLDACIQTTNERIRDESPGGQAMSSFACIRDLCLMDLYVTGSIWQAHMRGFLANMERMGGITAICELTAAPLIPMSFMAGLIIRLNTTSPAKQQVWEIDRLKDDELMTVLDDTRSRCAICPAEFTLITARITKLRRDFVWHATDPSSQRYSALRLAVQIEFDAIPCIDMDKWASKIESNNDAMSIAMAESWAVALRLYGILTLPEPAIVSWLDTSTEASIAYPNLRGLSTYNSLRVMHRTRLLELLREIWGPEDRSCRAWLLIVAGVAVSDGTTEDRRFVLDCLWQLWLEPSTVSSFIHTIEKLRAFWSSGKTSWEDCFYVPTESMP